MQLLYTYNQLYTGIACIHMNLQTSIKKFLHASPHRQLSGTSWNRKKSELIILNNKKETGNKKLIKRLERKK